MKIGSTIALLLLSQIFIGIHHPLTGFSVMAQETDDVLSPINCAKRAREKGLDRLSCRTAFAPEYKTVSNLDDALSRYALLLARPVAKHSENRVHTITTWYKLKILENLSGMDFSDRPSRADAPKELLPLQPDEILVPKTGGTLQMDGVEVTLREQGFPELQTDVTYLLFVKPDPFSKQHGRLGSFEIGPQGVFLLTPKGRMEPVLKQPYPLQQELEKRFNYSLSQMRPKLHEWRQAQASLHRAELRRQKAERMARRIARQGIPEEYGVYSVLIEKLYARKGVQQFIIQSSTATYLHYNSDLERTLKAVKHQIPEINDETLADFQTRNAGPHQLSEIFDPRLKVVLITDTEVNSFFGEGGGWWEAFYGKYPNSQGIMTLSRVGFNRDQTQALVYVGNQSAGLAGAGSYVFLTREADDDWVVQDSAGMWIS